MYTAGSAYIFYKDEGGPDKWGEIMKIVAGDRAPYDEFGCAVSISGDYAIVGAREEDHDTVGDNNMSGAGSAYIFYKDEGGPDNWGQVKKIVASDRDGSDEFGFSVSISGEYAMVGAEKADDDPQGLYYNGSAYIYYKDQGGINNWGQQAKIFPHDRHNEDQFGYSVSISGDYAVAGAKFADTDELDENIMTSAGAAYIFYKDQDSINGWGQVKKILQTNRAPNDEFGVSVSISGDYVLVGADNDDQDAMDNDSLGNAGSASVFHKDQGGINEWGEVIRLVNSDRALYDHFGATVAISGDNAIIGSERYMTELVHFFRNVLQASDISLSNITQDQFSIDWVNGDGTNRAVFIKQGAGGKANPSYDSTYVANTTFGSGTQIATSGWYCIYNGTGTNTTVTGLTPDTVYSVMVCDYYGSAGSETYYTSVAAGNPAIQASGIELSGVDIDISLGIIDYTDTLMQYSLNSTDGTDGDWYDCTTDNTIVTFAQGDVFVREKEFPTNYRLVATIPSPGVAPDYTINYDFISTNEDVPDTVEYNTDGNFSTTNLSGENQPVPTEPGTSLYFRYKAKQYQLVSEVQELIIPPLPAVNPISINYTDETTNEVVPKNVYYIIQGLNDWDTPIKGGDTLVTITPGSDMEFQIPVSDTSFASDTLELIVPSRPEAPDYSIEYISETTVESISDQMQHSLSDDWLDPVDGTNTRIDLTPGTTQYIRAKATPTSFTGETQVIIVPDRPDIPVVSLSDKNSAEATFKKSSDGSGADVVTGDGFEFSLNMGDTWSLAEDITTVDASRIKNIIVRKQATSGTFRSLPTENLDYETPVAILEDASVCNGPGDVVQVRSNIDNGSVYLVEKSVVHNTVEDLENAITGNAGNKIVITAANTEYGISMNGLNPGIYFVYATNDMDNISSRSVDSLQVLSIPEIELGSDIIKCDITDVTLDPGAEYTSYLWSFNDASTRSIQVSEENDYVLTVTDDNGCPNSDTISVKYNIPFQEEDICIVTVDPTTGKNNIVWERTPDVGVVAYNIYREATIGVYDFIGTTSVDDLSVFEDETAIPESQAYLYKITAVDTCGTESEIGSSEYHKPSFLQYISDIGGINLIWTGYEIQDVNNIEDYLTKYIIYRGTDSTSLTEHQTVGSITNWTDTDADALVKRYYYRVASVLKDSCFPANSKKADSGPYSHAMSNIEDNRLQTYVHDVGINPVTVYPNPFSQRTTIRFSNADGSTYTLYLTDLSGKVCRVVNDITTAEYVLEKGTLKEGFYFVELRGPKIFKGKIVIE